VGEYQLCDACLHRLSTLPRTNCPRHGLRTRLHLWRELGKTAAGHYLPFSALTAIHWVHRNFAAVVVLVLGLAAWRAWRFPGLHVTARNIALVLGAQALTGVATVFLSFPLVIAVLHNAGRPSLSCW
jgi:cytochrome c oxidase assembly protein subunit 15